MNKDIGLAVFGALLSLALGYLIEAIASFSISEILLIFLLIAAIFITFVLMGPLGDILRKAPIFINGTWSISVLYPDGLEEKDQYNQEMKIKQIGSYIKGIAFRSKSAFPFGIKGKINPDGTIIAYWKGGITRNGTMHMIASNDATILNGVWSGRRGDNVIVNGKISLKKQLGKAVLP
ncbi:MAG: hypothetical protein ACTSVS_11105 [Candidatus Heimdallarchaeota archaeon]